MTDTADSDLQTARQNRASDLQNRHAQERQLLDALSAALEPAAVGRLMNIRMTNPGVFSQLATFILQAAQRGQLKTKLSDDQFKMLAARLSAAKPATKINIQRK